MNPKYNDNMTPFSELAMRIAEDINGDWMVCFELSKDHTKKERGYFTEYYRPTREEQKSYRMDDWF